MDVRRERRFWSGYLTIAFGQRGPALDPEVLATCFGIDDEVAHEWWLEFTGWYEGVIEESDGQVDEPGLLEIPLESGEVLVVEAHPGDVYLHRRSAEDQTRDTIANFGPHWWIPEWSLGNARRLANDNPFAFLILSPLVRLGPDDDRTEAEGFFSEACIRAALLERAAARRLAVEWYRCAAACD